MYLAQPHQTPWKIVLAGGFLLFFAAVGIANVINPDWFIARSGVRKGGEMLTGFNRFQYRIGGAIFAAAALYMLYSVLSDYFSL